MKYYGVKSVYYEDGSITAKMLDPQIAPAKPDDTTRQTETLDVYVEWFDNRDDALNHINSTANISTAKKHADQLAKMHKLSKQMAILIKEMEEES